MIRNSKAFSLALAALLALGAFVAQGALASPLTVEGISAPGTAFTTGDQDGGVFVLKSAGGEVSCTEASFSGSGAVETGGKVNELTVVASFPTEKAGGGNNCTAFGFAGAHVKMNECTLTFTTPTSLGGGVVTWSGSSQLHLVCPTGKVVEITPTFLGSSVCSQSFAPQTPTSGHVLSRNVASSSPMDVTGEFTLTGIHYTGTGSSCGNSETHSDATLTGNTTNKCYSDSSRTKQVGCTVS
jgi:hypothetical protein